MAAGASTQSGERTKTVRYFVTKYMYQPSRELNNSSRQTTGVGFMAHRLDERRQKHAVSTGFKLVSCFGRIIAAVYKGSSDVAT
jgi:hypothetical protein